jgi:Skp family chaperone for outer membrane proteins
LLRPALRQWTIATAALVIGAALSFQAFAQEAGPPEPAPSGDAADVAAGVAVAPPFLTLNQDRLFRESAWGREAIARAEADTAALAAENRRIEEALEKEERDLTERRATMTAGDFARLASEFDVKVEEIRTAQDAKSRAIVGALDREQQAFFAATRPVMEAMLREIGATAIFASGAVLYTAEPIDITQTAIQRMDAAYPGLPPDPVPLDTPAAP